MRRYQTVSFVTTIRDMVPRKDVKQLKGYLKAIRFLFGLTSTMDVTAGNTH